mmetsp:Transcript_22509/g.53844  ORF Transcript_22509/g.53844 Transcript_22509/m.53844 type:complete len:216 (-) Transcript_22509:922-1569(-)
MQFPSSPLSLKPIPALCPPRVVLHPADTGNPTFCGAAAAEWKRGQQARLCLGAPQPCDRGRQPRGDARVGRDRCPRATPQRGEREGRPGRRRRPDRRGRGAANSSHQRPVQHQHCRRGRHPVPCQLPTGGERLLQGCGSRRTRDAGVQLGQLRMHCQRRRHPPLARAAAERGWRRGAGIGCRGTLQPRGQRGEPLHDTGRRGGPPAPRHGHRRLP